MKDLVVYSTQSPDGTQWIDTNSPIDLSATDPAALKAFIDLAGSVAEEPGVQEAIDRKWREQQQRGHLDESFELLEHMSSASDSLGVGSLEVLTPPSPAPLSLSIQVPSMLKRSCAASRSIRRSRDRTVRQAASASRRVSSGSV